MFSTLLLSELIQQKIPMGSPSPSGWHALRCQMCNDHSPRGGFKFEGNKVGYSCFNCGKKFLYTEGEPLGWHIKEILLSFGISREDMRGITSNLFLNKEGVEDNTITLDSIQQVKLHTPEVAFPEECYPLLTHIGFEEYQDPLLEYLLGRNIDPTRTQFYFSTSKRLLNRVIIPYWRNGKLIYWQARHIQSGVKPKYVNCTVAKDAVMYGYDRLHSYDETPLFVTEGVFNALMVNGVAIMSASLNQAKIEVLKKTKRRLIFIRDRDTRGDELSEQVIEHGWEVTTVDNRVNDVNDSVNKFGAAYTAYSLLRNAQKPKENKLSTQINLGIWGLEDRLLKLGRM